MTMADDRSERSVTGLLGRDSTDWRENRHDVISELRRRNAELTEAVRARDRFIAVAAHELRNPMAALYLRVQQLARIVQSSAERDPERLTRELARLNSLMERYVKRASMLLDVSRITAGKGVALQPTSVDFSALLRETIEEARPAASHAGSSLELRIANNVRGEWDRLALGQIIDNILSNAVKFGAGKPIEVSLAGDAETATFRVTDHGIGISRADQMRIFEPFERTRGAPPHSGFGIGLWLVRELVDAMGGHIDIASLPNAGSTFTIALPLAPTVPKGAFMGDLFDPHG
jgi:two-component system, OmpR family, sensor kinase